MIFPDLPSVMFSAILADTCLPTGLPTRLLTRGTKGREVGTLSYARGEEAKAYYPYRMVDYCPLLWFPRNRWGLTSIRSGQGHTSLSALPLLADRDVCS